MKLLRKFASASDANSGEVIMGVPPIREILAQHQRDDLISAYRRKLSSALRDSVSNGRSGLARPEKVREGSLEAGMADQHPE